VSKHNVLKKLLRGRIRNDIYFKLYGQLGGPVNTFLWREIRVKFIDQFEKEITGKIGQELVKVKS